MVLVEMENGLGVALGHERVSAGQEPAAELAIVVDLTVKDDDLRAILVEDRLPPPREINDAEPSHPKADGALQVDALVVRPAMPNRGAHPPHRGGGGGPGGVCVYDSDDTTHAKLLSKRKAAPRNAAARGERLLLCSLATLGCGAQATHGRAPDPRHAVSCRTGVHRIRLTPTRAVSTPAAAARFATQNVRSEEHTSELQSPCNLVCRLLLEKKKKQR